MPFGVVVLAAGGSSRFGRPKQLLPYLGRTLVEHAVRTALASGAAEVVVVVGAEGPEIRKRLQGLRVRIVTNETWAEGMGGSIAKGVAALSDRVDATVIALADQPRITPEHLRALAERTSQEEIVASSYDGIVGAPCAFARDQFSRLLALTGEEGARHLIRAANVAVIEFAAADVDVDTPKDYRALVPEEEAEAPAEPIRDPNATRGPPASVSSTS
jgi:molybdenum cofactor cytidylyltransferase